MGETVSLIKSDRQIHAEHCRGSSFSPAPCDAFTVQQMLVAVLQHLARPTEELFFLKGAGNYKCTFSKSSTNIKAVEIILPRERGKNNV